MKARPAWLIVFGAALICGCEQKMADQPRYDTFESSRFFPDGSSARTPPAGTVPRGADLDAPHLRSGLAVQWVSDEERPPPSLDRADDYAHGYPITITESVLRRGRERYGIYCAPCHGGDGEGAGAVTEFGYPRVEPLHTNRLRDAPEGYLFDVVTRGYGRMPSYAGQTSVEDRWAIIAFVRALQLSRHATLDDPPDEMQERFGQ